MHPKAVSPVTKKTAASLRRLQEAREAEREEAQKQTRKKLEDRHLARVQSEATLRLLKNRAEQELGPSLVRRIAAACIDRLDELRSACLTSGKSNYPGSKYGPALTANRPDSSKRPWACVVNRPAARTSPARIRQGKARAMRA